MTRIRLSEAIELVRDFRTRTQGTRESLIALEAHVFPGLEELSELG